MNKIIPQIGLDKGNSNEYKGEIICNSVFYVSKSEDYPPGFYYFVSNKG